MAHEYAMKCIGNPNVSVKTNNEIIAFSWQYADAMQAEADKRKPIHKLPALQQTFIDGVEQPRYAPSCDEWQPDWSQAPDWANWWAMDGFSNQANWYDSEPYIDGDSEIENEWNIELKANMETYEKAPSFNYAGNWQDSLRKRPQ